jgi:hypothetical protein
MDIVGVETWGADRANGSTARRAQWANTGAGHAERTKLWDCAYNNAIFNPDGYRYRDRPLGHSMDGDGEMYSIRYLNRPLGRCGARSRVTRRDQPGWRRGLTRGIR